MILAIEISAYLFLASIRQPLGRDTGIGPYDPQRRYHELMANPKLLDSKGKKWQQAQSIIDHWIALFHGGM